MTFDVTLTGRGRPLVKPGLEYSGAPQSWGGAWTAR